MSEAHSSHDGGVFSPALFRHRDFVRLWLAQIGSAFGSRITRTALPAIAILTLAASPSEVTAMSVLGLIPGAIIGIAAGGLIDRARKRRVMVAADLARALLVLLVPVAALMSFLSMPLLYAVSFLVGAATSLFQLANSAYVPFLAGRAHLVEANSKLGATDSAAEITGPAAAGILIEWLTAPVTMVIDAFTYLWSALMLWRIRVRETPGTAPDVPAHDDVPISGMWAGVGIALRHKLLRPLLLAEIPRAAYVGALISLYMYYLLETLSLSPGMAGIIIGFGGIGALAGAIIASSLPRLFGFGPAIILTALVGEAAALLIPLSAEGLTVPLLIAHQLIGDAFLMAHLVLVMSLRQAVAPRHALARVNGAFAAMQGLMLPVSAVCVGFLAEAVGVTVTMWIATGIGMLAPVILATRGMMGLQRLS